MEHWKDIKDYPGYQVSCLGNVRTHNKITSSLKFKERHWKDRILKKKISNGKYNRRDERVDLWKDGKPKTYLVSRLVALTWNDIELDSKLTINHIDGDPLNNRLSNLEIINLKDNIRHAFRNNLYHNQIKVKITDKITGTIIYPSSLNEGSKIIGKSGGYLSEMINNNVFSNDKYKWELMEVN